jgi:hypothetical protein
MAYELVREETYTFTPDDEPPVTIRSGRLREWLIERAAHRVTTATFPAQPLDDLIHQHGLEQDRLDSMTEAEAAEPIIIGEWHDGTHILIDGGHRRYFWAERGITTLRAWIVPYSVWGQYVFDPDGPNVLYHHPDGSFLPQRRKP